MCHQTEEEREMIRWLLVAALVFLVSATLQSFLARRRVKKPLEGQDPLPTLPPLPNATELENSHRELEALEQRLDIQHTGQRERKV
jgi:hypothetical protein